MSVVKMPLMKHISWCMVVAMFILGIVPRVDAGFVPSEMIANSLIDRTADMEKVRQVLETKVVSERLSNLGLGPEEVRQRLDALSDQQIHKLALQLDDLKIGQGDALGVIIALLLIAILVVLFLQLTGHRVIVK